MINVTETAASKITELLAEEQKDGSGLRVFVQGGGCSGFQYGLMIDEGGGVGDQIFETNGVQAVRRSDQHPLLERRRSRLRRHGHRRRLHHQEPERRRRPAGAGPRSASDSRRRLRPVATSASTRTRRPAARRRQAIQQARPDRQRVPAPGRPPQRRRSRRSDQARRSPDQPRHGLPHAAVDGGRGHRPQGGLRRRPLPLRALVPPSAPLSPDLQDLQPVVRVPQLRHRSADRGGRRRRGTSRRDRAWCRSTARARSAGPAGAPRRSTARPPSCCLRATRCASRSPPSAAASSSTRAPRRSRAMRAAARVFQKLAEEEKEHLGHARSALQAAARARPAARIAARRSCSSRARPTGCSRKAPSGCTRGVNDQQAYLIGIRCERGSHRFFKRYGERFEDSEGKQIFLEFAEEERAAPRAADPRIQVAAEAAGPRVPPTAGRSRRRARALAARPRAEARAVTR